MSWRHLLHSSTHAFFNSGNGNNYNNMDPSQTSPSELLSFLGTKVPGVVDNVLSVLGGEWDWEADEDDDITHWSNVVKYLLWAEEGGYGNNAHFGWVRSLVERVKTSRRSKVSEKRSGAKRSAPSF